MTRRRRQRGSVRRATALLSIALAGILLGEFWRTPLESRPTTSEVSDSPSHTVLGVAHVPSLWTDGIPRSAASDPSLALVPPSQSPPAPTFRRAKLAEGSPAPHPRAESRPTGARAPPAFPA